MMVSFATKTVVRIRPGTITERGTTYPDWENATEENIPNCVLAWNDTSMNQEGRVLGIGDSRVLYAPLTADIKEGDRIRYGTKTYEIEGDPMDWESPTGALDHYVINLKRYEG